MEQSRIERLYERLGYGFRDPALGLLAGAAIPVYLLSEQGAAPP